MIARDLFASAEGILLSPRSCLRLLRTHHIAEPDEVAFFEEFGFASSYCAQQVLAWLGY
jgi:hypothetical protein